MMKKQAFHTYQLQEYPDNSTAKGGFYMIRLRDLIRQIKTIDQPHAHSFHLLLYLWKGSGTHTIDGQTYCVTPPQLYFLTPGQVHGWSLTDDTEGYLLFFEAAFFQARYPKRLFDYTFFRADRTTSLLTLSADARRVPTLFDWAYQAFILPHTQHTEVFASLLHLLLEQVSDLYDQANPTCQLNRSSLVNRFVELLDTQFIHQKTCASYAGQLGISPNYLNHCCRQQMGKTASQLIYDRLLAEIGRLLLNTDLPIKAVSYAVGFSDSAYFSRFVHKHTGQTPQQFRQQADNR
ncbi:helix-turn-helix domain-containing protein [Spirosoma sp. HMF3257]|uniref:AraC family transcriptional regulator n=1 Tax=Spirosoma telluris TaxID=2183553 RepID=A0A327NDR9_9BACT|nr:helix-turn-helix domain-containing protein [Spirosoma telluris]RAI73095.1 AraC family transcriptional regulator [Spirosoma telluris]